MEPIKIQIVQEAEPLKETLLAISHYLRDNPETAYKEHKACAYLSRFLEQQGFDVEQGVGGVATAFAARPCGSEAARPCIALLAEYDALPKIGHGCGHNLIAAASMGAAVVLKRILGSKSDRLVVVGTPAEEGGGGKARLYDAGLFNGVDAALMFHPGRINIPANDMLGRIKFKMEFFGQSAHASGSPDQGINALDALVATYTHINALRQHILPDARIHGIITHGGDAPNIIPDYAAGLFYVRAATLAYRDALFERVKACAQGAALATGTRVKITVEQPTIDPFKRNSPLEAAMGRNMTALGIPIDPDDGKRGSSDIGNLSQSIPCLHTYLAIVGPDIPGHSVAFKDATDTERGHQAMLNAVKLLAMTAHDFLSSASLRQAVAAAFDQDS